jgi:hypothetical protein
MILLDQPAQSLPLSVLPLVNVSPERLMFVGSSNFYDNNIEAPVECHCA